MATAHAVRSGRLGRLADRVRSLCHPGRLGAAAGGSQPGTARVDDVVGDVIPAAG